MRGGEKNGQFPGHVEFEILLGNPAGAKQIMRYTSEERRREVQAGERNA